MTRTIHTVAAIAAGLLLTLAAAPQALGLLSLPPLASQALDAGVATVLETRSPNRKQDAAMNRIERLLRPGRRIGALPHQCIADAKQIVAVVGSRFDVQLGTGAFGSTVANEIGLWVDQAADELDELAVDAGRRDERRIARALLKAERLFEQGVAARDRGHVVRALAKLAKTMKQLQRVATALDVDISDV